MGQILISNCKIAAEKQRQRVSLHSLLIVNVTDPLILAELLWFIAIFSNKFDR